jgi:acetoin utilization deacetylase AcuC-like enzyme
VHHGNGTQQIFETDPTVLYFSIHRANIYPSFGSDAAGRASDIGIGDGRGYTVNCPWRTKGMGDDEYICAVQHLLLPIIDQFQPTLVFISAGFDAAEGDLGECCVTPQGFATLTRLIRHQLLLSSSQQQQDGRDDRDRTTTNTTVPILCALEGGYVRSMLAQCVVAVVEALLEDEHDLQRRLPPSSSSCGSSQPLIDRIAPQARLDIESTIRNHQGHWQLLRSVVVETPLSSSSYAAAGTVPAAKKVRLG